MVTLRIFALIGLVVVAIVSSLIVIVGAHLAAHVWRGVGALQRRRARAGADAAPALPAPVTAGHGGDAGAAAGTQVDRLLRRRQAAWRLRC